MTSTEFRQLRDQLGLSQAELGRLMGLTAREISRIELDRQPTRVQAAFIRYIGAMCRRRPGAELEYTPDFREAVEKWRLMGGAMIHSKRAWARADGDVVDRLTGDARASTVAALIAGGMSEDQVAREMENWEACD